jgi:hypothetical protein
MPGELLNGPGGRPTHGQVRTERVPKDMDARPNVRPPRGAAHHHLDDLLRERRAFVVAQDPRATQMPFLTLDLNYGDSLTRPQEDHLRFGPPNAQRRAAALRHRTTEKRRSPPAPIAC